MRVVTKQTSAYYPRYVPQQLYQTYYEIWYRNIRLPLENPSKLEKILEEEFELSKKVIRTVIDKLYLISGYYEDKIESKIYAPFKYARHRNLYKNGILSIEVNGDIRIFYKAYPEKRIIEIIDIDGHKMYKKLSKVR